MKQYEEFKDQDAISYGAAASSANFNKAPLLLKKELNTLYNYTQVQTGGIPLAWEFNESYVIGDYVGHNGNIYKATSDNIDDLPPSSSWEKVILSDPNDTVGYTKYEADNLLALKYNASNVPANPKFTDTVYDDTSLQAKVNLKANILSSSTLGSGSAMTISGQTLTLKKGDGTVDMVSIPVAAGVSSTQLLDPLNPLSITASVDGYQTLTLKTGSGNLYTVNIEPDLDWVDENLLLKADKATTYTKTEVNSLISSNTFAGLGAVGTYAYLGLNTSGGSIVAGTTYLGTQLKYAGTSETSISGTSENTVSGWGVAPSGNWMAVGTVTGSAGFYPMTMFVRIS